MSLRTRLLIGAAIIFALLATLATVVVVSQRATLVSQLDDRLASIAPLTPAIEPTEPGSGVPPPAPNRRPISDVLIALVGPDASVEIGVQGQLLETVPDLSVLAEDPPVAQQFSTIRSTDGTASFRVVAQPGPDGRIGVSAIPADDVDQAIGRLVATFAIVGAAIVAVLAIAGWWIWRLGLRPVIVMTETAAAVADGEHEQRIPDPDPGTEAGRLGSTINTMLDQRDRTEARLRQFVSDASHELRTPLTSIRGYVEVYQTGGFPDADQVADAMRRIGSESERMDGLVESLLRLARLDEEQPLSFTTVDIGELVRDACADAVTARPELDIAANAPERGELMAEVDAALVTQVVAGLIDNAAVHAPGAAVEVSAGSNGELVELVVADDGPGMAADDAALVFDRFYRSDSSRSRSSGGSGLGLAIAAAVAARHGGTIEVTTSPGRGSTFTLGVPARRPAPGSVT